MAQPVWTLSVDLQTRTATFQTGMADAAKAARGSFTDIKSGAADMAKSTSGSMMESRHGVMLLGEEFGVHLPRGLTMFLSSLGPVGAAMEAAFPFLAIIVGATLLLQHLAKLKEAGEKLTLSQQNFGTTVTNVLNGLDEKLLQAGIRTDELNHNHLDALNKQLQLIDRASMNDLVQAFGVVAKAADETFSQLKAGWYQQGSGSAGAKHALDEFKSKYDSLLAQGRDKEANDLLAGTKASAQHVLEMQKQIQDSAKAGTAAPKDGGLQLRRDYNALQEKGIGYTDKEVAAQQLLVDALNAQVAVVGKVDALKAADKGNARQTTQDKVSDDSDKVARDQAQSQKQAMEEADKLWEENYKNAVAKLQENEREKIDATKQGTTSRLQAIDAAIKEEESKGLQDNGFYKALCTAKVQLLRQMTDEQKKLDAEAGKDAADSAEKMGMLQVAADKQTSQLILSAKHASAAEQVASDIALANEEYNVQLTAGAAEIAALDRTSNEYANKLKALQDKQEQLVREHENKVTAITEKAEEERNARILAAEQRRNDTIAKGLTEGITRQETWGKMMRQIGQQVATGLIENAIKSMLADDMTKERDAAAAARKAFLAGEQTIPGLPGVVLGGAMAAVAFASVMAFNTGGIVPGVGKGDIVPAKLEPGEGVLSNKVMDGLRSVAAGNGSGPEVHYHTTIHHHVQALDSEGVDRVLTDHAPTFEKHLRNHARRLNG